MCRWRSVGSAAHRPRVGTLPRQAGRERPRPPDRAGAELPPSTEATQGELAHDARIGPATAYRYPHAGHDLWYSGTHHHHGGNTPRSSPTLATSRSRGPLTGGTKTTFAAPRRVAVCPRRIGHTNAAARALHTLNHKTQ